MSASINYFLALISLFCGATGLAFFFAAMKIKAEISLEIANQLSAITLSQAKQQYEDTRLSEILLSLKGQMDKNTNDITQLNQEIDQVKGFLSSNGFTRRHKRPPSES